jgi:hypothetical protein
MVTPNLAGVESLFVTIGAHWVWRFRIKPGQERVTRLFTH